MLCAKCRDLCSLVDPHQDKDVLHYENVEELRRSADSGCRLCRIVHTDLSEKRLEAPNISYRMTIKTRRNIGIEASFVATVPEAGGGPQTDEKSPVVYVIFQNPELPSGCPSVHSLRFNY